MDIKRRGIDNILVICIDDLKGSCEANAEVFSRRIPY